MLKIQNHLDILNRLNRFSSGYTHINTLEELAISVEEALDDLMDIEFSGLYLYDFQEEKLKLLVAKGFTADERVEAERTAMERHPGYVFRTKEIVNIPDTENDPEQRTISSKRGFIVRSRIFIPVLNGENAVGAFGIVSANKNQFTEEYVVILSFVCNIAGGIYGNILNQAQLRKTSLIAHETDNAVVITGKDGITEWVNPSFERITGYSLQEVKGVRPGDLLQGADTDPADISEILKAINDKVPIEKDLLNYNKNGTPFWVRIQIQPIFNKSGELTNFISIQRDITEQKKAHDKLESVSIRLSTLIKNLRSGILVEDQYRNIALINQAFCDLFNIPVEPEFLLGMNCSNSAEETKNMFTNPQQFIERIDEILSDKSPVISEILELVDGRTFERDYIPIFMEDKFLGNLWEYRDITARKQIENDLMKAKNEAESANAAKSVFLANMSHEIRTPLNAVIGLSKLMRSTNLSPDQKKLNDNLIVSGENLLGIINEILDFSKIEAGKIDLETIPFNLQESFDRVYTFLEHAADEKKIAMTTRFDPEIKKPVLGDSVRLQQILINLVSNAIKFTPSGSVEMSCKLLEETETNYSILFAVKDTGIGISEDKQKTIFEKFKQEDESVTRVFGGTGLGLAISRQLVDLMGGTLQVESEKGKGSRFFFTINLPITNPNALFEINKKIRINPETLRGKQILVVEDNQFNQFIVKSIIEEWNSIVTIAENGQEAIEKIGEKTFDIILMDMQMPVLDGCSATKILRSERHLKTPVIALTAFATQDAIAQAHNAGMDDYITKPFEEDLLYAQILKWLKIQPEYVTSAEAVAPMKQDSEAEQKIQYDIDKLSKLLGDKTSEIIAMSEKFIEFTPGYCQSLFEAFDHNNLDELAKAAHKIKSSMDIFASGNLRSNIRMIEEYAKTQRHTERLPKLINYLKINMPILIKQLNEKVIIFKKSIGK